MNGHDLLKLLQSLTPSQLDGDIRVLDENKDDEENIWLVKLEVSEKGDSGYPLGGEIRLIGSE